jgi:hypothetical protein
MVLLLAWSFGSAVAFGQEAIVTFYSHGSNLTTGLPGVGHDVYYGHIFDGTQGLFSFHDGFFLHNNRYLSLRLAPGTHTFGASNGKRPEARETLQVDLKPGESYFVRARGDSYGVPGVFTLQHGKLELIPCATAQGEMANAKPLKDKALWKYTKARRAAMVIDETNPPPCP